MSHLLPPSRTRRIAKWTGLAVCVVILAVWAFGFAYSFQYVSVEWFVDIGFSSVLVAWRNPNSAPSSLWEFRFHTTPQPMRSAIEALSSPRGRFADQIRPDCRRPSAGLRGSQASKGRCRRAVIRSMETLRVGAPDPRRGRPPGNVLSTHRRRRLFCSTTASMDRRCDRERRDGASPGE